MKKGIENISATPNGTWFWVYILKSKKDNRFYIGSTNNLSKRMEEHNEGKVISTKHRRPVELVYYEAFRIERKARIREKRLKAFGKAYQELLKRISED